MNDANNYRLERHSGKAGLERLFDEWQKLTTQLQYAEPCHFPHWYQAFLNRPDAEHVNVEFFAIYNDKTLAAVFPVGIEKTKRFNMTKLTIPINPKIDSIPDVVIGVNQDHHKLFKFFLSETKSSIGFKWHLLSVSKTLASSNIAKCLNSVHHLTTPRNTIGQCCYFDVADKSIEEFKLPKKVRRRIRNARNRLTSTGEPKFEMVTNVEDVAAVFEEFTNLEATGWKVQAAHGKADYNHGQAIILDNSKHIFFKDMVGAFSKQGFAQCYRLSLDGQPIAALISVNIYGTSFLLKMAYDNDYSRLSPGALLFEHVLQHNQQNKEVAKVILLSNFDWMRPWHPEKQAYVSFRYFENPIMGLSYSLSQRFRDWILAISQRALP